MGWHARAQGVGGTCARRARREGLIVFYVRHLRKGKKLPLLLLCVGVAVSRRSAIQSACLPASAAFSAACHKTKEGERRVGCEGAGRQKDPPPSSSGG